MNKFAKFDKKIIRESYKKAYKKYKIEDRKIGLKINELFKQFHKEMRLESKYRDIEKLKSIVENLRSLREIKLFRQDFPSFSIFKKYCKKEKVSLQDLE